MSILFRSNPSRWWLPIVGMALAFLVLGLTPTAQASSIRVTAEHIVFDAAAGETNDLLIDVVTGGFLEPDRYRFTDFNHSISNLDPLCIRINAITVTCPIRDEIKVLLGNEDDHVRSVFFARQPVPVFILDGGPGNDILEAGSRADTLDGGPGDDLLLGFGGDDELFGGDGDDELFGGNGDDLLLGYFGNDFLDGDFGNDELRGQIGHDRLAGGPGEDRLYGGPGDDLFATEDFEPDVIDCGTGFDGVTPDFLDELIDCEH